jgi:hypothetical protein
MALDIKTFLYATVYGIDSNEKHLEEALALGCRRSGFKWIICQMQIL